MPCVTLPGMRTLLRRTATSLCLAVGALMVLAPLAIAADGVGIYGRTDDKVVTFFAFGLMGFFLILVIVLSLIQIRLENRKQRRKEDLERLRAVLDLGGSEALEAAREDSPSVADEEAAEDAERDEHPHSPLTRG